MEITRLVLTKGTSSEEIVFDKKLNVLTDLALSRELAVENIKNEDSELEMLNKGISPIRDEYIEDYLKTI